MHEGRDYGIGISNNDYTSNDVNNGLINDYNDGTNEGSGEAGVIEEPFELFDSSRYGTLSNLMFTGLNSVMPLLSSSPSISHL